MLLVVKEKFAFKYLKAKTLDSAKAFKVSVDEKTK